MGALAVDPVVSLVDTAFVARLGTEALGALGVNTSVFAMAFLIFNFLANGTTPLIAEALGRGDRAEAGRVAVAGAVLASTIGVVAVAVLLLGAELIVTAMGAEEVLREPTLAYLRARAWSAPAVLLVVAGNGVLRGFGDATTPLRITIGLNIINAVLDPLLIFGLDWGIAGAAWATVAAQWAGAAAFWAFITSSSIGPSVPIGAPAMAQLRQLLGVGTILTVRTFALLGTMTVATGIATRMGPTVVAAHQVALQLWLFSALLIDGFALAGQALIGDHLGAGRLKAARSVGDRLLVWGLRSAFLVAVVLALASPVWPWFFELEAPVAAVLAQVMPLVILSQPLNALTFVWDGVFMGARRFGTLAAIMIVATASTLPAMAWVYLSDGGLVGLWATMVWLTAVRAAGQAALWYGPHPVLAR